MSDYGNWISAGDDYWSDSILLDVDEDGIARAVELLEDIPGGWQKAVGSALKRAARHGETVGYRIATERYAINSGVLKQYTKHYNTLRYDLIRFGYKGNLIPLTYYDVSRSRSGKLRVRVLRGSPYKTLDRAFVSTGLSYNRIRERVGAERFPTRELYGPSAIDAIAAAEDKVENAVEEEFDKRIDHEIEAILNGWRRDNKA